MATKISIIIPIYNTVETLDRCIRSIIDQTFSLFEVIAVDDGSTDGSGQLADKYAAQDARIRVIHQNNSGVSAARNAGIEAAKGEYVSFFDSDDYADPTLLETLFSAAQDNHADVVSCSMYRIWQDERVLVQSEDRVVDIGEETYPEMIDQCVFGRFRFRPSVWGKLYKRKLIHDYRIDFSGERMEDAIFNIKFLMVSKRVQILSAPLYFYHKRPGSATTSTVSDPQFPIRYISMITELQEYGERHHILERIDKNLPQYYLKFLKDALKVVEQTKKYRYVYDVLKTLYRRDPNFKVLLSRIPKKKVKSVKEYVWSGYRNAFIKMCYSGKIAIAAFLLWRQLKQ